MGPDEAVPRGRREGRHLNSGTLRRVEEGLKEVLEGGDGKEGEGEGKGKEGVKLPEMTDSEESLAKAKE